MCILDEMNLSHPEQYLAPILSAMEREGGEIPLHGGDAGAYGVPQAISYPGNLVIIGTVNMDETTMGVSDKVLDRAFTLEFWEIDVGAWPGWESSSLPEESRQAVQAVLTRIMTALSPARLHFGWRVISRFLGIVIAMYYNEHGPPHFHARYGDRVIRVGIEDGRILSGRFPRRAQSLVLEWLELHRNELLENWELAEVRKPLMKIAPLE